MSFDLSTILGGAANAASGGLLGLVGSALTGVVSIFQARTQFSHDEKMADLELQRIKLNTEAQRQLSADQLKALEEKNSGEAFSSSQIAGNSFGNLPGWAAAALALVRPTLTALALAMTYYCFEAVVDPQSRAAITSSILALTGMSYGWWFGDRQISKMVATRLSGQIPSA